ncbi:CehA/McbA family metallohydrolase [Zobellella maritima]|uniref:CehA/McbA family metallohydrolase n=1 Tax=Zobellella maritima TaxID=2059725 RepID=UPI000E307B24|nr:CehA/McbA family metallohydrolase [Zobellella maritima]
MLNFSGELTFGHQVLEIGVPEGTTAITIEGTTVRKGFLHSYLYDAGQRLRGNILWLKPKKQLVITAEAASMGAIAGPLEPGVWQLHLYNLEGEHRSPKPMQYQVEVSFEGEPEPLPLRTVKNMGTDHGITFDYSAVKKTETAWYRGDLHAHTSLSDGHNRLEAVAEIAAQQQLDFLFLTEHNMCQPLLPDMDQVLFLPAIEVTTALGHFNLHGPCRTLNMNYAVHTSEAMIEQGLALAGEDQGSVSVNHPMMKPWHWHYQEMPLARINTLEICCDPTWSTSPEATEQALQVLNGMWNAGHRIHGVGGSDCHLEPHERNPNASEPSIYGDPSTFVFSHGLSGEGILAGLRQGHVYLERRCGLAFSINQGSVLPGQDVGQQVIDYRLSVRDTAFEYYAECIADGRRIAVYPLGSQDIQFRVDMSRHGWLRVDIRRANGDFEGMINPVYNGQTPAFSVPTLVTWGELMEAVQVNGN